MSLLAFGAIGIGRAGEGAGTHAEHPGAGFEFVVHDAAWGDPAEHFCFVWKAGPAQEDGVRVAFPGLSDDGSGDFRLGEGDDEEASAADACEFEGIGLGDVCEEDGVTFSEELGDGFGIQFDDDDGNAEPLKAAMQYLSDGSVAAEDGVVGDGADSFCGGGCGRLGGSFLRGGTLPHGLLEPAARCGGFHEERGDGQGQGGDGQYAVCEPRAQQTPLCGLAAEDHRELAASGEGERGGGSGGFGRSGKASAQGGQQGFCSKGKDGCAEDERPVRSQHREVDEGTERKEEDG